MSSTPTVTAGPSCWSTPIRALPRHSHISTCTRIWDWRRWRRCPLRRDGASPGWCTLTRRRVEQYQNPRSVPPATRRDKDELPNYFVMA